MERSQNKKRILLTGFGPFGEHHLNPTQVLVQHLGQIEWENCHITSRVLDVDCQSAWQTILPLLSDTWDAIILTGLAAARERVSLELLAQNKFLDRSGQHSTQTLEENYQAIMPNGPITIDTKMNGKEIQRSLERAGMNVECSIDAGTYLCNYLYYRVLFEQIQRAKSIPTIFIHFPFEKVPGEHKKILTAVLKQLELY